MKKLMSSEYKRSILFIGTVSLILVFTFVIFFTVQNNYFKGESKIPSTNVGSENIKPTNSPNNSSKEEVEAETPVISPKPSASNPPVNPSPSSTPGVTPPTIKTENDVISYFEEQERLIMSSKDTSVSDGVLSKIKSGFVTIVDFLFYEKEINGYTFEELSTSTKLKVLKIASTIDLKIDQYFPDYKASIKSGVDSLKAKAISMYLTTTAKLCDAVGDATCNQAREDFKNMKKYLKIDWNLIKGFVKEGTGAIKEWYESFK